MRLNPKPTSVLLGDIAISKGVQTGPFGSQLKAEEYTNEGIPVVMPKDIKRGYLTEASIARISMVKANSLKKHAIASGDIIFPRRGDLRRIGVARDENTGWICGTGCLRARLNSSVYPEFLHQYVQLEVVGRWLQRNALGQTMLNLNTEIVSNLPITLPALPEQKAIALLLSTWDEAIEITERLIVKKQKFYKAQLSKHLSLDVSERVKIKNFLKEISKRNRDLSITQVLSVTNSKGFVRPEDQFARQVASDNLSNYKIVSKGEYAYNPSRINVGSIARLDGWDFGVLSPMYTVFKIKKPFELHTDLFLHWLNSHEAKQRIKLSAQGTVRETVSFDDFSAIGFPKIDFKKQKALADYFSLVSAEIDTLKALSEKYKTQKRGLMQKMLTGEWRIKPEIINQYRGA